MRIGIQGREYAYPNVLESSLWDMKALTEQAGITVGRLAELLEETREFIPEHDPDDMADRLRAGLEAEERIQLSPEHLLAIGCLVWLARRKAGEDVTLEEACNFPYRDLQFLLDPEDMPVEPESPDPQ